jgi:hypothetical protein
LTSEIAEFSEDTETGGVLDNLRVLRELRDLRVIALIGEGTDPFV